MEPLTGPHVAAMTRADALIGVSRPDLITSTDVALMADRAIVFALANPDPEIDSLLAGQQAASVATGRSDYPNQINNVRHPRRCAR